MPIFDVYLARTYRVRVDTSDESAAQLLAEEFVGEAGDRSTAQDRASHGFQILAIEMVDNQAFDAIVVGEGTEALRKRRPGGKPHKPESGEA